MKFVYLSVIVFLITIAQTNGGPLLLNNNPFVTQFPLNNNQPFGYNGNNPFGTPFGMNSMPGFLPQPVQHQQLFPLASILNTFGGLAQGIGYFATSALGTIAGLLNGILGIFTPPTPVFQMPLPFQQSFNPFSSFPNNVAIPNTGPRPPTMPVPPTTATGATTPAVPGNAAAPAATPATASSASAGGSD